MDNTTTANTPFYNEFGSAFFLTLAGAIFGFGGVCLQAILKSRCTEIKCCGISCKRIPPDSTTDVELNMSPLARKH